MIMKSSESVTYKKAQGIIMHLLCDKDCKIEDDCTSYAEKYFILKQRQCIYLKGNRNEW